ncbi:MAG: hypothetical protein K2J20_04110, partial [Bacilli bacterium]|nr:hypothetical protein [Bacilli bacterium]
QYIHIVNNGQIVIEISESTDDSILKDLFSFLDNIDIDTPDFLLILFNKKSDILSYTVLEDENHNKESKITIFLDNFSSWNELPKAIPIEFVPSHRPYDLAVNITTEDLDNIVNNIVSDDLSGLDTLYWINEQIDNIIAELEIDANTTDQEILDKVLLYVTEHYEYDMESYKKGISENCYKEGLLWGVFHNDNKIVCGNYAALVQALLKRLGVECYYIISYEHAWNLVNIQGNYYYVDATWLDDSFNSFATVFKNGVNKELAILIYDWYLVDPTKVKDDVHIADIFPGSVPFVEIKDEDYNFLINLKNGLRIVIPSAISLGLVIEIFIFVKEKLARRRAGKARILSKKEDN